jgi:cytochrome c
MAMTGAFRRCAAVCAIVAALAHVQPASAAELQRGEATFKRLCAACHNLDGGRLPLTGPTLDKLIGRKAAAVEGFGRYSQALRDSTLVWDAGALDRFLADPKGFLPGTSHAVAVRNEEERAALLAYLEAAR